jgi:hypothetical protein
MGTNRHATRNVAHDLDIAGSFCPAGGAAPIAIIAVWGGPRAAHEQRRKGAGFSITVA